MPRPTKIRFTLDLSPEANQLLEQLASHLNATKSEILRKAICLMEIGVDARKKNQHLAVCDEGDQVLTKIVGI